MIAPEPIEPDREAVRMIPFPVAGRASTSAVRRRLSPQAGRAIEMLGHAIEYLADEYAAKVDEKGPLGNADPRVEAIQILKGLNRSVYYASAYSDADAPKGVSRIRRWLLGEKV